MAKRSPRSEATDSSAAAPAPPRTPGRVRKAAAAPASAPEGAPAPAPPDGNPSRTEPQSTSSPSSEEDIRLRAYHLYLERGQTHGAHEDDWVRAERELKNRGSK